MKLRFITTLSALLASSAFGAPLVSVEKFEKITTEGERRQIIENAPPEQREQLKQIHIHLALLAKWKGEEGLKKAKETQVARARGLGALERVFGAHINLFESYISGVVIHNLNSGMTSVKCEKATSHLKEREGDLRGRR